MSSFMFIYQSAKEGYSRAEDHWRADGAIQTAIKEAKSKAEVAAVKSQVHWLLCVRG